MKRIIPPLIALLLISPSVFSQKTIFGTVDYTYKLVGAGAEQMHGMMPEKMEIKYGKNGIAIEMYGGSMTAAMGKTVVNGKTGEAFIIKEAEKTVYLMSDEAIKAEAAKVEEAEVSKLDETREIMGYICQKYLQSTIVQGMSMSQVIWAAKDLKAPDYEGEAFKGMAGQGAMSSKIDGFPMLIEIEMPGMTSRLQLKVSNIDYKKIPDSTFDRPDDYTMKDFSEMRQF